MCRALLMCCVVFLRAVLSCPVLRCAVCCAVLCCAVLCCVVLLCVSQSPLRLPPLPMQDPVLTRFSRLRSPAPNRKITNVHWGHHLNKGWSEFLKQRYQFLCVSFFSCFFSSSSLPFSACISCCCTLFMERGSVRDSIVFFVFVLFVFRILYVLVHVFLHVLK